MLKTPRQTRAIGDQLPPQDAAAVLVDEALVVCAQGGHVRHRLALGVQVRLLELAQPRKQLLVLCVRMYVRALRVSIPRSRQNALARGSVVGNLVSASCVGCAHESHESGSRGLHIGQLLGSPSA